MNRYSRPISRPTVGRYVDQQSADTSVDTLSTYRPTSTDMHVGRHPPILHHNSASTTLIWSALVAEFYLLYSTVNNLVSTDALCTHDPRFLFCGKFT